MSVGRVKIERSKFKSLSRTNKNKKSKYRKNRRKFDTRKNHQRDIVAQINLRKPESLGGFFDLDTKLFKRKSKPILNLKIINAGLPNEVKTLYFIDKKANKAGKGRLSYKVDVDFDDSYYIYVKAVLRDLLLFKREITGMNRTIVKTKAYNRKTGKIKNKFLEKYFNKYNKSIVNDKIWTIAL